MCLSNRWLYQFTPYDARKLIDHRTLQTLYLQTQASRTWIILYQIHYSLLLQMVSKRIIETTTLFTIAFLLHTNYSSNFSNFVTGIQHYDLIIIGGGPAGQGAAEFAAFAGRRTLVIEREVLGGLVVTTGGGPTKTLREAALHLTGFRYRALYGITEQPDIVMAVKRSRARTEEVSSAMQNYSLFLCRQVRSRCHL